MLPQVVSQWCEKTRVALAVYDFLPFFSIPICDVVGSVAWIIPQYRGLAFFYTGYNIFCILGTLFSRTPRLEQNDVWYGEQIIV